MERFLVRHKNRIAGTISGFDRMIFRGTLLWMTQPKGMGKFLNSQHVLLKEFGAYAESLSQQIKQHAQALAEKTGRPQQYIATGRASKDKIARSIAQRDQIREGLICVLSCLETSPSFAIEKDRATRQLRLVVKERRCLHFYFYYMDRDFGLMHIRVQSWAPYAIQIYVNGREWLAKQMDRRHMIYEKHDNCFTSIADLTQAQQLMDRLDQFGWVAVLNRWAQQVHPLMKRNATPQLKGYYWSLSQAEYATDVVFHNASQLRQIYPSLLRHALDQFSCRDVLRFLGRRLDGRFEGEVRTHWGSRVEGFRIKHWVEENSIKMYDKAGSVLRIETTINNTARFKVRRKVTRKGQKVFTQVRMRKGVVDIRRRVQLCLNANARYLDALAVVGDPTPSHLVLDPVSRPVAVANRRCRPLRPISPEDSRLFQAILRAEHLLHGIRNRDLRKALYPDSALLEPRLASAATSRLFQLLRAHQLIYKVPHTHCYRITKKGHTVMSTALRFRITDAALLAA
jgi:hypothetical protein